MRRGSIVRFELDDFLVGKFLPGVFDHDIAHLQVSVDDSLRVEIIHAFQNPSEDLNGFSDWNGRLRRSDGHSNMIRKRGFFHDNSSSN